MGQEVTTQSWGTRLKNAVFGVLFGTILIIGAIYFIFVNEKTGLHTSQSLKQTAQEVRSIANAPIDPQNDLHVVHFSGEATTKDILKDPFLNISENAIRLLRKVEMFQWKEESETKSEDNLGGSQTKTTTYNYHQDWFSDVINSSRFHEPAGHQNPNSIPITSATWQAQQVMVGDFKLPKQLIGQIEGLTNVNLDKVDKTNLQTVLHGTVSQYGDYIYVGENPRQPAVGDLRISETMALPQMVSIIAQQRGKTLQAYVPPAGKPVALLVSGEQSPQDMIQNALRENNIRTWLIRAATLLALFIGFALILQPIVVLSDVVPLFGRIVGIGTGIIAFICGVTLWAAATAIAWFTFRPIIAIVAIIAIILIFVLLSWYRKK